MIFVRFFQITITVLYVIFLGLTPLSVVIETLPTKTKGKSNSKSNEETLAFSPTNRRNVVNKKNNNRPASPKKNAASTSQNNLQQCPICDISFSKDKIQVSYRVIVNGFI